MNTICVVVVKVVQIATLLIFAAYTLASSLPTLALSLRQFSSPIFVFFIVNTSIFLLSLPRFFPSHHSHDHVAPVISSDLAVSPPIGEDIEDEFEIGVVAEEDVGIEKEEEAAPAAETEMRSRLVVMLEKEEEEEAESISEEVAEEQEEVSNAEFNRMIEAFLAKQRRFHCQENISILV